MALLKIYRINGNDIVIVRMYNGYKNFLVNGAVKMWVRVALNKEAMRIIDNNGSYSMSYIEGGEYEEYYLCDD